MNTRALRNMSKADVKRIPLKERQRMAKEYADRALEDCHAIKKLLGRGWITVIANIIEVVIVGYKVWTPRWPFRKCKNVALSIHISVLKRLW